MVLAGRREDIVTYHNDFMIVGWQHGVVMVTEMRSVIRWWQGRVTRARRRRLGA